MTFENLTKAELKEIIQELKKNGYDVRENNKISIIRQEAAKLGISNMWMSQALRKHVYSIADWVIDNQGNKSVPIDKEKEYRGIISGILNILKPYYGKNDGFREKRMKEEKNE